MDTWYFIAAWYDAVAGTINISVNNGTPRSTSSPGPTSRGNGFSIGQTLGSFLAGRVQGVGVWDRVLTSAELTALYNSGNGLQFPFGMQVLAQYAYLGLGTPVQVNYPQPQVEYNLAVASGANHYTGLDDFGRVIANAWQNISGTPADLVRLNYGYDQAGNRLWRQDVVAGSANLDELYGYDGLYRLNEMQRGSLAGGGGSISDVDFEQDWTLDPTGNWGNFTEAADGTTVSLAQTRVSNTVNEIHSITNTIGPTWSGPSYDPAGNMISMPQPTSLGSAYSGTFDAWKRLTKLVDAATGETVQVSQYDGRNYRIVRERYSSGRSFRDAGLLPVEAVASTGRVDLRLGRRSAIRLGPAVY